MKVRFDLGLAARTLMFALLPFLCTVAILGTAPFVSVAGYLSSSFSLLRQAFEKRPLPLLLLLGFAAWAAASSLWSPYLNHVQALKLWLTLAGGLLFAGAASASRGERRWTFAAGLAAFLVLAALLGVEALWRRPLNHALHPTYDLGTLDVTTGRATSVLVLMVWGCAVGIIGWGRASPARIAAAAAILVAGGALSLQFSELANATAFGFGAAAFALAWLAPRLGLLWVSAGTAAWMLVAPFATPILFSDQRLFDALPMSAAARVVVWRYVASRIAESPWFGHGLDASRTAPQLLPVRDGFSVAAIPLHPHSASMQVWFETGAVGAILAAAALLTAGWSLSRALDANRPQAAAAAGAIAAIGVIGNLSYGLWQEWWDAAMFVAAALVAAAMPGKPAPRV
ncbi:MAG: hypothetical protein JSS00_15065 [Proteobacteria bacterium]|nr:hypothetical protein [Pseudomonadota bacterium]